MKKPLNAPKAAGVSDGVLKKVLPNGMTVMIKEVQSSPVVALNAWVKVGSVHEQEKERGGTHFIEHMLFKGTDKLKVGELDKLIKAAGGYNNAHTRYESTDFIDVMPADQFDIALETMADALQHSKFDAQELDRERKVVLEELHRAQDNPGFEAWNTMTNLVFEKHPYKYPVIGYKHLLEAMDREPPGELLEEMVPPPEHRPGGGGRGEGPPGPGQNRQDLLQMERQQVRPQALPFRA